MNLRIFPPEDFLEARVTLPLSKSMSARALIINALTPGSAPLGNVASCDDTDALVAAPQGDSRSMSRTVDVGAAGTTMRFLTAYYACRPGCDITLDGSSRMRQRPIKVLVDALRALGADITYAGEEGFPPLRIRGRELRGGELTLDASVSSQYISALLMTAPVMTGGLKLTLTGEIASRPYILMTLRMMKDYGVDSEFYLNTITVPAAASYKAPASPLRIEGDWSAAAAWYEITALSAGAVSIDNLAKDSCQGDRCLADIYARLGVDTDWEGEDGGTDLLANPDADARASIDFSDCPDLAQYVTVTCAMLGIPFSFTGLHTLAIKETDRVAALKNEMAKLGMILDDSIPGTLRWDGSRVRITEMPVFDTYADHRMAMCLAPVALYIPGIVIRDAEVVSKSYPGFWDDLAAAGFTLAELPDTPETTIDRDGRPNDGAGKGEER